VRGLYSMLLGPDDALLALRINFQDGLTTDQLEQAIDQVTAAIRKVRPTVHHVVIEPES
jgi:divalent metal cation (Fe/Co/Zn/Cd) transporter